jgi:hypothetical protein
LPAPMFPLSCRALRGTKSQHTDSSRFGVSIAVAGSEQSRHSRWKPGPSTYYIQNMRIVEEMNSEKNMPVLVMNAAGYVQKMPAVE